MHLKRRPIQKLKVFWGLLGERKNAAILRDEVLYVPQYHVSDWR